MLRGFGFLCAVVILMTGCAARRSEKPDSIYPNGDVIETTIGSEPLGSPFTLEVLDEVNDGENITIRGRVISRVDWSNDDLAVRLSTLNESSDAKTLARPLRELIPQPARISRDSATEFVLSLPSQGVSNYQIELLWGDDAKSLLVDGAKGQLNGEPYLALRKLEVHRVPSDECGTPDDCIVKFTITGEFFNAGTSAVRGVTLEAGFSPADKLDLPSQILDNTRRIKVRNLNLAAGGVKPFKLALERLIPSSEQIAPRPVVRIVAVDPA